MKVGIKPKPTATKKLRGTLGKDGITHYRYKTMICIIVKRSFIHRYKVNSRNLHKSQVLQHLHDPKNKDDYVSADQTYTRHCFDHLLSLDDFKGVIHEKLTRITY